MQRRQISASVAYTAPPSTERPSSPYTTRVDVTYQIVRIKPTNTDWLIASPSDLVQIMGAVSRGHATKSDDEAAAADEEDDAFEIPCAAHLAWGASSIYLTCLYYPSASHFTASGECAHMADKADSVKSVGITMQDTIIRKEEREDEIAEDMRDDNGNPFMVLHVNKGIAGSARLYCKKITASRNGLMDKVGEKFCLDKSSEETGDQVDVIRRTDRRMPLR